MNALIWKRNMTNLNGWNRWTGMIEKMGLLTLLLVTIMFGAALSGCEDAIPTDYVPEYVVTAYLFVDKPVTGINITQSQNPLDTFVAANSVIDDATVTIWSDADTFHLEFVPSDSGGLGSYRAVEAFRTIQPQTTYRFRAEMSDGSIVTAETTTPERIEWLQEPRDSLYYPKDTTALVSPDSLKLIWTKAEGISEYLVNVKSLDTLEYGTYLTPPTTEKNRRIVRFFEENAPHYNSTARWGFVQNTSVNTVWVAFKWFGKHTITVYAPDVAMLEWFKQLEFGGNFYSPLLSNLEGGIGVFGSASVAEKDVFLYKNQP